MNSLKKRVEVENQIHKADHILIMGQNMDLLKESEQLGKNIKILEKKRTDEQNKYKQMCTKFGIRPAKNIEELSD